MSGLSEYRIPAPGGQTITVQLSDADAKAYGDNAVAVKVPANKSKAPANKAKVAETAKPAADSSAADAESSE